MAPLGHPSSPGTSTADLLQEGGTTDKAAGTH